MLNGCVRGRDDCGCSCHRVPGVKHVMPCCDKPQASDAFYRIYDDCEKCDTFTSKENWIDRKIYHDNNHVWPGFAGEPDSGNYGGSDF